MSLEKFPTPAQAVIAERMRRAESDAILLAVAGEIPLVVRAEPLVVDQDADTSLEGSASSQLPYEMQVGTPRFAPHHDPRPLTPPSIPAPEVAPSASYPNVPPKTL